MLQSKAAAALMRFKEIDRKYNIKRNEGKRVQSNVSTESSLEDSPRNLQTKSKTWTNKNKFEDSQISSISVTEKETRTKASPKSKMEVKIPLNYAKDDESSVSDSISSKKSPRVSPKTRSPTGNNKNGRVEEENDVSRRNQSSSTENSKNDEVQEESYVSRTKETSLTEDSKYDEVQEESDVSRTGERLPTEDSKNDEVQEENDVSRRKKRSSTEDSKNDEIQEETDVSRTKESYKSVSTLVATPKFKNTTATLGPGDSPRNNNESSVATLLSKRSNTSEVISEAIKSDNETRSKKGEEKSNVTDMVVDQAGASTIDTDNNEITTEEAIKSSEERNEIISELSNTIDKNVSMENISFREEQKSQYEDDTFEEASTSVGSSSSVEEKLKKTSEEDTVISGVKQIKITPHRQTENVQKFAISHERDKEIVELVAPKIMQSTSECDIGLDEELSNYVRTTENVQEAVPISLLKLSKQITTPRKHMRKSKKHRKSSNENTEEKTDSFVASEHERLTDRKENNTEADIVEEDVSSTFTKSVREASLPSENKQNTEEYSDKIKEDKSETKMENDNLRSISSEEKFLRETPRNSDVTSTLRKLNKDAINAIVRRNRVQTPRETFNKSRQCKNCGTVVKLPKADASKNVEDETSDSSSEKHKDSTHDQKFKEKKYKSKKASRSSKNRKTSNYSKVEGKHSRFNCRQTHRLQKHAAAFRLQQEREDIRNYLLELERTRLEFGPGESVISSQISAFKPLEFPKIAAFVKPDLEDASLKDNDGFVGLQERVLTIRQWLKDQYILYRDYSSLAQTVNSKYIPASLEDAKRMIRQLQRATIKSR